MNLVGQTRSETIMSLPQIHNQFYQPDDTWSDGKQDTSSSVPDPGVPFFTKTATANVVSIVLYACLWPPVLCLIVPS